MSSPEARSATRGTPRPPMRRGPLTIGPFAFVERLAGEAAWRLADPATLPVPPLETARARGPAHPANPALARTIRAATLAIVAVATLFLAAELAANRALSQIVEGALAAPPGTPLDAIAGRLESAGRGAWWARIYPSYGERLARAGAAIRAGGESLAAAASAYETCAEATRLAGPIGRLTRGSELVEPAAAALDRVASTWHRGTLAFREMREAIRPYRETSQERLTRLRGTVVASPVDHALLVMLVPAGAEAPSAQFGPLVVGGKLDLPIDLDATVRLEDFARARAGEAPSLADRLDLPMARWPDGEIRFPRSNAAFAVRLDDEWARLAPALAPLSPSARAELGLPHAPSRR